MEDIVYLYEFDGQKLDGYVMTDAERSRFLSKTVYVYPLVRLENWRKVYDFIVEPKKEKAQEIKTYTISYNGESFLYDAEVTYPKTARGVLGYANKVALAKKMKISVYPYLKKGIVTLKQLTQYLNKYPELLIVQESVGYVTEKTILVRK